MEDGLDCSYIRVVTCRKIYIVRLLLDFDKNGIEKFIKTIEICR